MSDTNRSDRNIIVAVVGVGIALLAVLVPLQLSLYSQLGQRIDRIDTRLTRLEDRVEGLAERVARIEGRFDAVLPAITLAPPEPADQ